MAVDPTYPLGTCAIHQSGNLHVPSGNRVEVESGAELRFDAGSITGCFRYAKVALVVGVGPDTTGLFAWQNPEVGAILVTRVLLDVTTPATAACTVDIGQSATVALSDNLIDGPDCHTAAALFDNITDGSTNGKARQKVAATQYVTGFTASGASLGMVANAYIEYLLV